MSASIAATSSEGGASTLGGPGKRRRVRKRQSRQQLGGAKDNELSGSSSEEEASTDVEREKDIASASGEQGGEESKGGRKRKRTRSKKTKEMSAPGPGGEVGLASPTAPLADTGGGQSDGVKADEAEANGKEKRKRKRTRGKGRKEDEIEQAAGESAPHAPVQPTASMQAYLDSIGLPQDKSGLSEKTVDGEFSAPQLNASTCSFCSHLPHSQHLPMRGSSSSIAQAGSSTRQGRST